MSEVTISAEGIGALLQNMERGEFIQAVNEQFQDLVAAIAVTERKGKISLEISIEPNKKTGTVEVSGKVKISKPEEPKRASVFCITPDNNLSRMDARQRELFEDRQERRFREDTGTYAA